jgi:predicted DNA-binding transcriptional regulator AlpA
MHPAEYHRLINVPQAAEYLGISASTLSKRRVFGGGPKYLKLGRRVVYDTRDLDAWLDAHRRGSTSDAGDVVAMPDHGPRALEVEAPPPTRQHRSSRQRVARRGRVPAGPARLRRT